MLQAWGRWTSPRSLSSNRTGAAQVRCSFTHNALVVPTDDFVRESAPSSSNRAQPVTGQPSAPEKPLAGRITPSKLARLSEVLRLPITRVETVLQHSPAGVRNLEPEDVMQRLKELCSTFCVSQKQAAFMLSKQPAYMLLTPIPEIHAKIQELSNALNVPPAAVLRTALTVPSILRRSTSFAERRVVAYSALLRCTPLDVLHIMARGPEYLSDTPSSVRQRMTALGYVLRRPQCTIAAMLQARPDLAFMSGKVMNTKVNGLMCIMNKQKHHVVTLVVKLPALLRCNLDSVRHVFSGLQAMLQKREGFVYAMVCHAPSLLLLSPRGLHQRCTALQRCLSASPEWCEQFTQLRPPGVAQLILNRRSSLSVMMYLTQRRRAGAAPLAQLLLPGRDCGAVKALGEVWPDFVGWMERRRQYIALRMHQHSFIMRAVAENALPKEHAARHGPVAELHSLLSHQQREQQELLHGPEQQDSAFVSASAVVPPTVPGGAAARTVIALVHHDAGVLPRHVLHRFSGTGPHVTQQSRPATSPLEHKEDCSSSRNSFSNRREVCARDSTSQQDAEGFVSGKERQQPCASTSGRQPSWLQLQAEYSKRLLSRTRQQAAPTLQQMTQPRSNADHKSSPCAKHARMKRKARVKGHALLASAATQGSGASADGTDQPFTTRGLRKEKTRLISEHHAGEPAAFDSGKLDDRSRNLRGPHGTTELSEHQIFAGPDGNGSLFPSLDSASAALSDDEYGRMEEPNDVHTRVNGYQDHRHLVSSFLLLGCGQQPDAVRGVSSIETSDHPLDVVGFKAPDNLFVAPSTTNGSQLPRCMDSQKGSCDMKGTGDSNSSDSEGTGSGLISESAAKCRSAHHGADPDARNVPLWLRINPCAIRSSISDQAEMLECMHQGESEADSSRRGNALSAEPPQHGATNGVVVVSGDGFRSRV